MKKGWSLILVATIAIAFSLMAYFPPSQGTESEQAPPGYNSLGTLLVAQGGQPQHFINQFFTEQTLTVTNEGDGFVPGTLRTVLLQAAGIRHNNPFTLIKIVFDPLVKIVRIMKGPLPVEKGLITLDCAGRVTIDGTQFDSRYLEEGEQPAGFIFRSSGNTLKGCKIIGFPGRTIVISGNRNHLRENTLGTPAPSRPSSTSPMMTSPFTPTGGDENHSFLTGISLEGQASENLIEGNTISGYKREGIALSAQVGTANRIVGNSFQDNGTKGIHSQDQVNRSSKPVLRPIVREGDSYIIAGTVSEASEIEIYMASANGREGKLPIAPPFASGRGDFSVSVKNKGFVPGVTKIVALSTATGRNTSEFSEPVVIPAELNKSIELPLPPPPQPEPSSHFPASGEETKSGDSNTPKAMNEKASSALSAGAYTPPSGSPQIPVASTPPPTIDPFLNATTLPPPTVPQSSSPDSVRVESVTEIMGAP